MAEEKENKNSKGIANIRNVLNRAVRIKIAIKIAVPIIIFIVIISSLTVATKESRQRNSTAIQGQMQKELEISDINELVEIKGAENTGYYLEFVDDIDDKLQSMLDSKEYKEKYKAAGIEDISTLKKFIKAELVTQYPHLGKNVGGSAVLFSGGIMDIPHMYMKDWNVPFPNYENQGNNVNSSGCGFVSISMVISYLTGVEVTPKEMVDKQYKHYNGIGADGALMTEAAELWGVGPVTQTKDFNDVEDALKSGKPVISLQNPGIFTRGMHYIVLTGIDDDGKTHVNDPGDEARSNRVYDLETQIDSTNVQYWIYEYGAEIGGTGTELLWPTDGTTISSGYGYRDSPTAGASSNHRGLDIAVPTGTNVYACQSGTVTNAEYSDSMGNYVYIDHGDGYVSIYMHNSSVQVSAGDVVTQGQVVAISGSTGISTGPHLHFQINKDGEPVDPNSFAYSNYDSGGTEVFGEGIMEETDEDGNTFQGAIKIRRVSPNKVIGSYTDLDQGTFTDRTESVTEEGLGTKEDIPDRIKERMKNVSLPEKATVDYDDLSYLTIPYVDFMGEVQEGHMIVNKDLADEVLKIFQELYNIKYPIEKMEIVDTYVGENGNTNRLTYRSIDDNNTSAFNYLSDSQNHKTGNAIDLNPQINPYVNNGEVSHDNQEKFLDREEQDHWTQTQKDAMIDKDSEAYEIFNKYGWTWGGDRDNPDYKHFEKTTTTENDSEDTSINSKIQDLRYVPEDVFDRYVEENSNNALQVFTLDENMKLTIASWSYSTDGGLNIKKGQTIDYKKALSKYTMPYEYLIAMACHTEDVNFCEGLADISINSEYIIAVQDKVSTTQTTVERSSVAKIYNSSGLNIYNDDPISSSQTSVSESASQTIEVTYVDCWFVKFSKESSYSTEMLKTTSSALNAGAGQVSLSGEQGDYIGEYRTTAYCNCTICCGQWSGGPTASGRMPTAGLTVACNDPNLWDKYIYMNDHVYRVEDTGNISVMGTNTIDIYMNDHNTALQWGVKVLPVYWANGVDGSSENSTSSGNVRVNRAYNVGRRINVSANVMGKISRSESSNISTSSSTSATDQNGNYSVTTTTTTTTTRTITYEYNSGESTIGGNSEKFVELYKDKECKKVRSTTHIPWLVETLEKNSKTVNLVDITKYLFYQANGKFYEVSTLKFNEYEPGEFKDFSANGLSTFKEYLHAWEGNTGVSSDGTKYIVGDDGFGHPTVGYGMDIYNSGYLDRFIAAGYDVSVGAQIDVEFVDALEDEEINRALQAVETECAGLELTQYQKYALVSRIYNCGTSGAFRARNGKTFVQAYDAYWNQERDDEYRETMNDGMYNHQLYSTYMYAPNTSNGQYVQGLENRRKSEWILFKTGYYDRIDKWCSESGEISGDFLEVADQIMKYMQENNYSYCLFGDESDSSHMGRGGPHGLNATFEESKTGYPLTCCATYVCWVLHESGYEDAVGMHSCENLIKYLADKGAQQILQPTQSDLQPGDIVFYGPGGADHTDIYAGDGLWYNAGGNRSITGDSASPQSKGLSSGVFCIYRLNGN